jgi:hypothetical protein
MSITQARFHSVLIAGEAFALALSDIHQRLREAAQGLAAHPHDPAAQAQLAQQAIAQLVLTLPATIPHDAALILTRERVAYNYTWKRNEQERARKARQRQDLGTQPQRARLDRPAPTTPYRPQDNPAHIPQRVREEEAWATEHMRRLDAEESVEDTLGDDTTPPTFEQMVAEVKRMYPLKSEMEIRRFVEQGMAAGRAEETKP